MSRLDPDKLHVRFADGASATEPVALRCYTLTHSDATGDLFLTVGLDYDRAQISGLYTRLMRDEVLAEWRDEGSGPVLHVYCHVSGGLVFGTAGFRYAIFQRELPLVLEAFRFGDRQLFQANPTLDESPILVHFQSKKSRYRRTERWRTPSAYR
jgi:hypothetical protein